MAISPGSTLADYLVPSPASRNVNLLRNAALVLGFSIFTALCAQVSFHLPITPVPVTLQTLAVLLTGAALGSRREEPTTWLRAPALFARFAEVSVALGVALFALTGSVEQQTAAPAPHSVIRDYFRAQPPVDDTSIDYFRWLRAQTAAAGAPVIVRSTVRLPAGGRYDVEVEQVEIVTNPTATPR